MRLTIVITACVTALLLLAVTPAFADTTTSGQWTLIDEQSKPDLLKQAYDTGILPVNNTFNLEMKNGLVLQPSVWIYNGNAFNFTIKVGGATYHGYVNYTNDGVLFDVPYSATEHISLNGECLDVGQLVVPAIGNERRFNIGYAINMTSKQHYICIVDDSGRGVGMPIGDLHNAPITAFGITAYSGTVKYQARGYTLKDYNAAVGEAEYQTAGGLIDDIESAYDTIEQLFDFIMMLVGFLVVIIENWYLVFALFEAGAMVLALDKSPDIMKNLQTFVKYNVDAFNWCMDSAQKVLAALENIASTVYNALHALWPLG